MVKNVLYWTPRILGILAILFMMMFSLDCFEGDYSFNEKLTCLFMHNLPSLGCILLLIIAWKWELIGGLLFILISIAMAIFFKSFAGNPASLVVISPFLITGILFIVHHQLQKGRSAD
ncbi:MAG: hypothetical protein HOO86_11735 [Bacteroidales bacterium]|nr:hypothetical protein [Bacteroidales bacterium]